MTWAPLQPVVHSWQRLNRWIDENRAKRFPSRPPGWRAKLLWIVLAVFTAWISGRILITPATDDWLWSSNVTMLLNGPNFEGLRLPAFSTILFVASLFLLSVFLFAPYYLLHKSGSWKRYAMAVVWMNLAVLLGPIAFGFVGGILSLLLKAAASLFTDAAPKLVEAFESIQFGFEVTLPWAPPDKPFVAKPNLGCLLAMLLWLFLILRQRDVAAN